MKQWIVACISRGGFAGVGDTLGTKSFFPVPSCRISFPSDVTGFCGRGE